MASVSKKSHAFFKTGIVSTLYSSNKRVDFIKDPSSLREGSKLKIALIKFMLLDDKNYCQNSKY